MTLSLADIAAATEETPGQDVFRSIEDPIKATGGLAILKGMAFAIRQVFRPNMTVRYPEELNDISPRHRGRLILVYDEAGALKCETCFQCAQACPIECIDMGGVDTRDRYHVHWGAAEQYAERREESALRRSGRPVPDRNFDPFETIDLAPANLAEER